MTAAQEVLAAEAERQRALIAGDVAALNALFADDLVHVHTTGIVHGKADIINHATAVLAFKDIRRGALNVRISGDIALVTGDMTNVINPVGTDKVIEVQAYVTQAWRRDQGVWRAVTFHAVRKPD